MNSSTTDTAKDLLLPVAVSQKDEKPLTAGLDDDPIPHFKIKITETPLEKKFNTISPHVPLVQFRNVRLWPCRGTQRIFS